VNGSGKLEGEEMVMPAEGQTTGTPPVLPGTLNINMPPAQPMQQQGQPPEGYISRAQLEQILNEERERVRQEEKNKLYPELNETKSQLQVLMEEREKNLQAAQAAEQARLEEEQRRQQEEASAKDLITQTEQRFQEQFAQMQQEREMERAVFAKEQQIARLNEYKVTRIAQERDAIAPQFDDLVRGNTPEEIDASIELMKAKTSELVQEFQAAAGTPLNGQRTPSPNLLPVSGAPTLDPNALTGQNDQRTLTAQEIYDMPIEEYAQMRGQLTQAASARVREMGLYAP